jgi:hypothetical protein
MTRPKKISIFVLFFVASFIATTSVQADSVTDWDTRACDLLKPESFDTPTANRILAIMHTSIYEGVNAITKKYPPSEFKISSTSGASVDAAVAGASRTILLKFVPAKALDIELAFKKAIDSIPDGPAKAAGLSAGERAAAAVLAVRNEDGFAVVETYRPYTIAGVYVPTALPLVSQWPQRKPWIMTSANQFRPGPPPDLKSDIWARDYNEIKAIGRKNSTTRTSEQTDVARFWEATGAVIYHGLIRSVTDMPGRDISQNARLMMIVSQAMDDALIAVFDAKYQYNFWRPVTAIRNGDIDGNDKTERDASWTPFINTPMHPEYPCAHCIVSATVGTILEAEIGKGAMPSLSTKSPTAQNAKRTWSKIEDFIQEVSNGRIYDGVHFRTSTEVGVAMGRKVGALAVAKYMSPPK